MVNYEDVRVKLTNIQLNKLKSEAKNLIGITLKISKKIFLSEELPHELLLTKRQKAKINNAFINNVSADIELSKTKIFKINQ